MGRWLHLDHSDDRFRYIGFAHGASRPWCGKRCNQAKNLGTSRGGQPQLVSLGRADVPLPVGARGEKTQIVKMELLYDKGNGRRYRRLHPNGSVERVDGHADNRDEVEHRGRLGADEPWSAVQRSPTAGFHGDPTRGEARSTDRPLARPP
jgi:hypothetical protein